MVRKLCENNGKERRKGVCKEIMLNLARHFGFNKIKSKTNNPNKEGVR